MSAVNYTLRRHRDVSDVSGTGPVATICEFSSGLVAMHWDTATPSIEIHTNIRHIEDLHGHKGASTLELIESRLVEAYARVVPFLLAGEVQPRTVAPHPDHPDRLRLTFRNERVWRFWIALLDGSSDAAVHVEVNGEIEHRWTSPDGLLWLIHYTPAKTSGTAWETHDDPELS